jgi:hypothetical protein
MPAPKWRKLLNSFIDNLRIVSREESAKPGEAGTKLKIWDSQKRILAEVAKGMDEGVRKFYVLKSRQLGSTTIWVIIALFWLALHPRMKGALVVDQEKTRDDFREQIRNIITSIPAGYFGGAFGIKKGGDNKYFMAFTNGSQLNFLVAGTSGSKTAWGESSGYSLVLLTEVANYGSPEGLNNFEEAMSEDNEERLYVYESTAKGFNHWRDRWLSARADPFRSRCIFVGWWSKELNQIKKNDPLFAMHGLAPPDDREREKIKIVKERYDHEVTMEQLAWYRYRQSRPSQSEESLNQNQPWYEEEAFVLGGKSYFQTRLIAQDYERIGSVIYVGFRFWFGRDFWSTRMENLAGDPLRKHEVELRVWHPPVKDGRYVIGVDPALGSSERNDRHAISVWRCYADKLVQVAEYADNMSETRQCAWVLAYLAGIYRQCVIIIELTGGYGNAVKVELNHLRELLFADFNRDKRSAKGEDWSEFLSNARSYLYRRTDSPGSAGHTEDFMTTNNLKGQIFNEFRDAHINGYAEINSKPLLEEMQIVVQNGDEIAAPGNQKDDRTFAACLATHAWVQHERPGLVMLGETYATVEARESGEGGTGGLVDQIVSQYLAQVNAAEAEKTPAQTWLEQRGLA